MFLIVNYSKNKINVILSILYAASVSSIVVTSESQPWTSRLFRAGAAAGFEEVVLTILLIMFPPIQGLSVSGVMVSQKTGLISGPDCPCLNDYKFLILFIRSELDSGLTYLLTVVLYCPQIGVLVGDV